MSAAARQQPFEIAGTKFPPGTHGDVDIPVGALLTGEPVNLRVHVIHGRNPGPRVFVSAAIHGDEHNGVEIVRRLLRRKRLRRIRGTLLLIPVTNIPGFLSRSRYLPDRRDLNRLFPGSAKGSLGARLARAFQENVASRCTHGIDLHTGAVARPNLPQTRIDSKTPGALEMARAFRAPVIIDSPLRDGSLRSLLAAKGIPLLLYEAGEALYLDASAIRFGERGVVAVLRHLEMLPALRRAAGDKGRSVLCRDSFWIRSETGGILRSLTPNGRAVKAGERLGFIGNPFSAEDTDVVCPEDGIVIGQSHHAVVDEGDALFHIGVTRNPAFAELSFLAMDQNLRENADETFHDDLPVDS